MREEGTRRRIINLQIIHVPLWAAGVNYFGGLRLLLLTLNTRLCDTLGLFSFFGKRGRVESVIIENVAMGDAGQWL